MLKIKIDDIDELYLISLELGMFTYLQGLVQFDKDGERLYERDLKFARSYTESYLWERQYDTVLRLRKLLTKEDFAKA